MRKLLALLFVASAFTFASCGKSGENAAADSTAVSDSVAAPDPAPADSVATTDSSAVAPTDSAK